MSSGFSAPGEYDGITTEEWEDHVKSYAKEDLDLNYAIIGICGEAGECAEWFKKVKLRKVMKTTLTDEDLKGELGDVIYYVTRAANLMGWTLQDIFEANIDKLKERA